MKMLFVGGLHRSGTSLVTELVASHPEVSRLVGTGVPEDEGQLVQSVYETAGAHGGPGRFALDERAHLTEHSPLATAANAARLQQDWAPHWSGSGPVFVEKSPPNLIRARFLQELFPDASFLMVKRHPVAVALATNHVVRGRPPVPARGAIRHWVHAHDVLAGDLPHLRRVKVIRFEDFTADPAGSLAEIFSWLGLEGHQPDVSRVRPAANERYIRAWCARPVRARLLRSVFGRGAARHGYELP